MRTIASTIGMLALLAASCGGGRETQGTATLPAVRAEVTGVAALTVAQKIELYGTVGADRVAAVSSRVMATVTAVLVKAGDSVQTGQVLAEIDPATAQGQEAQARGALAQAQAALVLAERNHKRYTALAEKHAASELELDMAGMQFEQAKGAVEQAQGALAAASSVAKESRVLAPFAGRVAQKLVEVGDLAAPGRPLLVIESDRGRRLHLTVPESLMTAAGLALGATVPVRLDALPALGEVAGKVVEMSPGADPLSHTFTIKIEIAGVEVASGASGRASLPAGERKALAVPRAALVKAGGVDLVVVRDTKGRARSRAVTLGAPLDGGMVEILAGVAEGEQILLGLAAAPADGSPVEEARP
ncbi:MAG: efflux RND transporter periplasmic adaptor subunit [Acidobacteriota bacterium]